MILQLGNPFARRGVPSYPSPFWAIMVLLYGALIFGGAYALFLATA